MIMERRKHDQSAAFLLANQSSSWDPINKWGSSILTDPSSMGNLCTWSDLPYVCSGAEEATENWVGKTFKT